MSIDRVGDLYNLISTFQPVPSPITVSVSIDGGQVFSGSTKFRYSSILPSPFTKFVLIYYCCAAILQWNPNVEILWTRQHLHTHATEKGPVVAVFALVMLDLLIWIARLAHSFIPLIQVFFLTE